MILITGPAPIWPTVDEWLDRWEEVEDREFPIGISGMKRCSIFRDLPYWKVWLVHIPPSIYRLVYMFKLNEVDIRYFITD